MGAPKYLVSDTETGGFDFLENPLLTAYFMIMDENFEFIDDLSLAILPYGDRIVLTEEALKVNGIKMEDHNKVAISHTDAAVLLQDFFKKHKVGNSKLTAIGQNFEFDRGFIFSNVISQEVWNKYCVRGYLDTKRIMDFMVDLGIYPSESTSLEKSVAYLEVEKLDHHNAKADAIMTLGVYKKLKNMIKNGMSNTGQFDESLLEAIE